MGSNQKKPKSNAKLSSDAANDQLGENASMEFARDYDNKGITQTKKPTKNK